MGRCDEELSVFFVFYFSFSFWSSVTFSTTIALGWIPSSVFEFGIDEMMVE